MNLSLFPLRERFTPSPPPLFLLLHQTRTDISPGRWLVAGGRWSESAYGLTERALGKEAAGSGWASCGAGVGVGASGRSPAWVEAARQRQERLRRGPPAGRRGRRSRRGRLRSGRANQSPAWLRPVMGKAPPAPGPLRRFVPVVSLARGCGGCVGGGGGVGRPAGSGALPGDADSGDGVKVANAATVGVGGGVEAVPRVASVSTSQAVKKSGGAQQGGLRRPFQRLHGCSCRLYAFLTVSRGIATRRYARNRRLSRAGKRRLRPARAAGQGGSGRGRGRSGGMFRR